MAQPPQLGVNARDTVGAPRGDMDHGDLVNESLIGPQTRAPGVLPLDQA